MLVYDVLLFAQPPLIHRTSTAYPPHHTRQMIEESEEVYVSPISLWEVSNKCRKGKLQLKCPPREWFDRILQWHQLRILPLTNEVMFRAGELHEYHKDPADRMIIASALIGGLVVVTADRNFPLYGVQTIK